MIKNLLIFIFPLTLFVQSTAQNSAQTTEQSTEKKDEKSFKQFTLVISADLGLDYTSVAQRYIDQSFNLQNSQSSNSALNYNVSAEFGVLKWLGLGALVQSETYFTQQNSVTETSPSISSYETGIVANIHLIRKKHIDWRFGGTYGFSHLNYDVNNGVNGQIYGQGSWADIHVSTRFYFGRFGLNYMLYMPFVNYSNLSSNNSNSGNQYTTTSWKAFGVGIEVGIQYRFF
jgi:hypothetical protein